MNKRGITMVFSQPPGQRGGFHSVSIFEMLNLSPFLHNINGGKVVANDID